MPRLSPTPILAAAAAMACVDGTEAPSPKPLPELTPGPIELAGPAGSGEPALHAASDGSVLLTWLEPGEGDEWALLLARRSDGAWATPDTVRRSVSFFVNWADFPSPVEMADGTVAVHWLERVADAPYAYHVLVALSRDGGRSWSEPIRVHDDDSPTEHGFVSMVPWQEGAALTWLDGRQMWDPDASRDAPEHGGGEMSLRFRVLGPDGTLHDEARLDGRTCECCQTAAARAGGGVVVAYRDRSEAEIRDISVVRGAGTVWSAPAPLAEDGWEISGCPVNGPQLSAADSAVVAAWFTGARGEPRVHVAFSSDAGATFGSPIRVDAGRPIGRVDVERLDDGSAVVTWLEASEEAALVLARVVDAEGRLGEPVRLSETSAERASGFPRMASVGDELIFAWTLPGDDGGVRVRSARVPELP